HSGSVRFPLQLIPDDVLDQLLDPGTGDPHLVHDQAELLLDLVEPLVNLVEPPIDCIEALVDLLEALVDLLEPLVDLVEAVLYRSNQLAGRTRQVTDVAGEPTVDPLVLLDVVDHGVKRRSDVGFRLGHSLILSLKSAR
ncbi:MAG: hypothetical protein ACRDT2_11665, partial [Natronosporangium sp.]